MSRICMIALVAIATQRAVAAEEQLSEALKSDVILRAMVDELDRNMKSLTLEDLERPYFIEYAIADVVMANFSATLGAITNRGERRWRPLRSDVRVGSYELDNTNFGGAGGFGGFGGMGAQIPIEDDYRAIRQALWWLSDADYKGVTEDFVHKKAFMESKLIVDKPNDFSKEEPAVYIEELTALAIESEKLESLAKEVSAVFRDYPTLKSSSVSVMAFAGNQYLVNTEGTRLRSGSQLYAINASASVQAKDGMVLSDRASFEALDAAQVPSADEVVKACREMVDRLLAVRDAPTLESYTGPVLFNAEPSAALFALTFARQFPGRQRPVGSGTSPNDFSKKLGKRILPKSVTIIDDPTVKEIGGEPAFGHYVYDDQGVRARPIMLVEKGRLKAQLMSRNPSKEFDHSTGHGRGLYQPRPSISNLIVSSDEGESESELLAELHEACEDEDLEFGLRVAALGSAGGGGGYRGGVQPLVTYKVFPDGREELIRGVDMTGINLKAFKRILAVGDTPHVASSATSMTGTAASVAVPALLFEELDFAEIDRDFDKPPVLPPPLARDGDKPTG